MTALAEPVWRARARAHEERVDALTAAHRARTSRGEKHPVEDFLFTYYSHRPSHLRRWSPGAGVTCEGLDEQPWLVVTDRARTTATWVAGLLEATASRPASFGCFGLHEWAMVYKGEARHDVPLRLGPVATAAVVDAAQLRCTHHDAFRFFTDAARPLNLLQPTRGDQVALEQGGCLHANMDLYKWGYKLSPWVPAELVVDCFALTARIRGLDMAASPYSFAELEPVRVETPEGRAEYVVQQRAFAAEAAVLRDRLLHAARAIC